MGQQVDTVSRDERRTRRTLLPPSLKPTEVLFASVKLLVNRKKLDGADRDCFSFPVLTMPPPDARWLLIQVNTIPDTL